MDDMLEMIETTMKQITVADLGASVLNPERYAQYVKGLMRPESILSDIRYTPMESQRTLIDRVVAPDRVLRRLSEGTMAGGSAPTFKQVQMDAVPLIGYMPIYDPALRRNLEGGNFESTLVDLMSGATRRDIEEFLVFSRVSASDTNGDILLGSEGFIRQSIMAYGNSSTGNVDHNILYGVNTSNTSGEEPDFDPEIDKDNVTALFDSMLKALPSEYTGMPSDFKFYVPFEVADAYRDYLASRNTLAGDEMLMSGELKPYKGVPVKYCPVLDKEFNNFDAVIDLFQKPVILTQPSNLIFGLFQEVKVEVAREPKYARTDFVIQTEPASGVEVPEACVVALPDADKNDADALWSTT